MDIKKIIYSSPAFIFPAVINLVSLFVFTRSLSLEVYGELSLALITIEFLQGIIFQWIKLAMMRFFKLKNAEAGDYLSISFKFNFIAIVGLAITAIAMFGYSRWFEFKDYLLYEIIIVGIVARGLMYYMLDYLRISRNNLKVYTIMSVLSNVMFYLPANIYVLMHKDETNVNLILALQTVCLLLFLIAYLSPRIKTIYALIVKKNKQLEYRDFLQYGAPLIIVFISSSIFIRVDRYIIEYNIGLAQLGAYSASFSLSNLAIGSFFTILTLPTYPEIIKKINNGDTAEAKNIFYRNGNIILGISAPVIIIFLALNPLVCKLLFAKKAAQVTDIFPYVMIGTFMYNFKIHYFDQIYQFIKRTKIYMFIGIILGVCHLSLGYYLSKHYGARGVAVSGIFLNTCGIIFTYFYFKKSFEVTFHKAVLLSISALIIVMVIFKIIIK